MHPYVELASEAIREKVLTNTQTSPPSPLPAEFEKPAGIFVSIKEEGELRGCIGTILPTRPTLAEEIIANAIAAASRDPRFDPVRKDELERLSISVDVLSAPEPINGLEDLDPVKYGLIVSSGLKRGLLLPNLEGIDRPEHQLQICKRKAGIHPNETVTLQRFTVTRYR